MPNQETVIRRSYLAIGLAVVVLIITLTDISDYSMDDKSQFLFSEKREYVFSGCVEAIPEMLYYPSEDPSLYVYVDERFVDVSAKEPNKKTQEELIDDYIYSICERYDNVTPALIRSIIMSESSFNPKARNGSHLGLMQVSTVWHADRAKRLGVTNFYDPYENILLGTDYVSELIYSTNGDVAWALMIYNMGHKKAHEYHQRGVVSSYASEILSRV